MRRPSSARPLIAALAASLCLGGGLATAVAANASGPKAAIATVTTSTTPPDSPTTPPPGYVAPKQDGLGITPGKIKHVWLIILENKSYDATFSGLNNNSYLWQTLPKQGALLQNYFGTGHYSLDNYLSLVAGQAPETDTQSDCPYYDNITGSVETNGSLASNPNYGQLASAQGAESASGSNGCVYPASVPTLFNQFDAAHVSWKGYAQDLGNPDASGSPHSAGVQYCGAPYATPGATGSTTDVNPGAANATDQYVPKHFPFPWFESILKSGDCDSQHIANLFDSSNGLYHDLQHESTTPAFSWITPNNCSDGHDAVCRGNNLSGGFSGPNTINAPTNYTGGLYAADLFLEHVVPEIESSPAFKDGGLIDVTFDEGFPPFTFTGNSFANSALVAPTAATSVSSDSPGETLFGRGVNYEPAGPNTPLVRAVNGQQLSAGPGNNAYLDRPSAGMISGTDLQACTATATVADGQCQLGGGGATPGIQTETASAASGSSTISDNAIAVTDEGRSVTGTGIPTGAFVGQVQNTPVTATTAYASGGFAVAGSFTLVDQNGNPLPTTGAVSSIALGAESAANDPLYDAYDATDGGGDTGSVLISPYIIPGTVSQVDYNHYSWLRTMEDLFDVSKASRGLDGDGHIGYAAQPGLAPFGSDVFTNADAGEAGPRPVVDCVVPAVRGLSVSVARLVISAAQCRVGAVKRPHRLRRGQTLVVTRTSVRTGRHVSRGTRLTIDTRAVTRGSRRTAGRR